MNLYIITGASKGLGLSITNLLLSNNNNTIIGISRNPNKSLLKRVKYSISNYHHISIDLSKPKFVDKLLNKISKKWDLRLFESITLINNAGTLIPLKPIDKSDTDEIIYGFNLNTIAPIILASKIISKTIGFNIRKEIINISSGSSNKPFYGWSCYCSSKAALEMFAKVIALEQKERKYPTKILSFIPGIIDTDMQKHIRSVTKDEFYEIDKFINYKNDGKLLDPDYVASKVISILNNSKYESGLTIDIKTI